MKQTYELTSKVTSSGMGEPGIRCLICGLTSYHPGDIKNLYCANCRHSHRDNITLREGDIVSAFPPGAVTYDPRNGKKGTIARVFAGHANVYGVEVPGYEMLTIRYPDDRLVEWRMIFLSRPAAAPIAPTIKAPMVERNAALAEIIDPEQEIPELRSWPWATPRKVIQVIKESASVEPVTQKPWWRAWWF